MDNKRYKSIWITYQANEVGFVLAGLSSPPTRKREGDEPETQYIEEDEPLEQPANGKPLNIDEFMVSPYAILIELIRDNKSLCLNVTNQQKTV